MIITKAIECSTPFTGQLRCFYGMKAAEHHRFVSHRGLHDSKHVQCQGFWVFPCNTCCEGVQSGKKCTLTGDGCKVVLLCSQAAVPLSVSCLWKWVGLQWGLQEALKESAVGWVLKENRSAWITHVKYCRFGEPSSILQISSISQWKTCSCWTKAQWFSQGRQEIFCACYNKHRHCESWEDTESLQYHFLGGAEPI